MYIGTDLIAKSGLSEIMDKIDFSFSIDPSSIPFLDKYGININATKYTIYDIAPAEIKRVLKNLSDKLTVSNVNINGRNIDAIVKYNDNILEISTDAFIR